jgi:hypothetical protein
MGRYSGSDWQRFADRKLNQIFMPATQMPKRNTLALRALNKPMDKQTRAIQNPMNEQCHVDLWYCISYKGFGFRSYLLHHNYHQWFTSWLVLCQGVKNGRCDPLTILTKVDLDAGMSHKF